MRKKIQVKTFSQSFPVNFADPSLSRIARIGDQDVQSAKFHHQLVEGFLDSLFVSHVSDLDGDSNFRLVYDKRLRLGKSLRSKVDKKQAGALLREQPGRRQANPRGGAGDPE